MNTHTSDVKQMPEQVQLIIKTLQDEFGDCVDAMLSEGRVLVCFRGRRTATSVSNSGLAIFVVHLWERQGKWDLLTAGMSIPMWAALRDAGLDVSNLEYH